MNVLGAFSPDDAPPEKDNGGSAPPPVLSYESPRPSWPTWMLPPIWAKLSLPTALIYLGFTAYLAAQLPYAFVHNGDEPRLIVACIRFSAPLGILALGFGILGRLSESGRERAGRAVRVALIVPGVASVLLVISTATAKQEFTNTLFACAGVVVLDILVILLIRDR